MAHRMRLLVGPRASLRPFAVIAPSARAFATTPAQALLVLPLTDDVHAALHGVYGTGEWLDFATEGSHPLLTTTDMAFAANASKGSALVWLEVDPGGQGEQIAAAWIDGGLQMKPTLLREGERRQPSLRPINAALRMLGVVASGAPQLVDEFETLGLHLYLSDADIVARATPVML
jgi:hypothetical protein